MSKQNLKLIFTILISIIMFGIFKSLFSNKEDAKLQESLKNNPFLVDVRTAAEFSGGSVKGAVNIPLDKISTQIAKFKDKKNIVVFCRSGNRSGQAKRILEQAGITDVINGGSWQDVRDAAKAK